VGERTAPRSAKKMNLAAVLNADRVPGAFEAGLRLGQEQASAVKSQW